MGNHLPQTSHCRIRYTVKAGDTPGNIAARLLGDVRYADLLVTINRVYTVHDETVLGIQTRFLTQSRIELPSSAEMQIYSRHYFTAWTAKKSWLEESATSVSSFLSKMREVAHRGAEKLNTHSNQISSTSNSKINQTADLKSLNSAPLGSTIFNGGTRNSAVKPDNTDADMPMQNQQRIFDSFVSGKL